jgi:hypothetical protein
MNKWDEMREAIKEAEITMRAADSMALDLAKILVGRLRKIDTSWYAGGRILGDLKRELRDFNIQTRRWKP